MKTITMLLFAIILNACGASNKATTNLVDSDTNKTQQTLNGTFNVINTNSKNLTITFDETTNRVSGFSGCNNFFGNYTLNKNSLVFSGLGLTRKMCEEQNNLAEQQMITALNETTSFEIKDNKIIFKKAEKELLSAIKNTDAKIMQDHNISIEYSTSTRAASKKITLKDKTVSVQNRNDNTPKTTNCSNENWAKVMAMVSNLNLKTLTTLEPPSKAHQYDGAPLAYFSITKDGETYKTPAFDAGKPNKEIEPLVSMLVNIGKSTTEKN
ncbi:META domain-containing protein [Lacinutrix venerupis]|nr:META domain-containing protein [Lacinutrix venerupis]